MYLSMYQYVFESTMYILFMLYLGESKRQPKIMPTVICHTISLVFERHYMTCILVIIISFYSNPVFGSALNSVDSFLIM